MALDGIFLTKIKQELLTEALGLRVDRVNQPTKDEIILNLRGKGVSKKLLICVRADSARVHFTAHTIDNPQVPPMFCMLMRKYLTGAMIVGVRQQENDRILFIDFDATNEIGDRIDLTLCVEIMGKYSNLMLLSEGTIIDAVKRVDFTTSSVRQVLPGTAYQLPASQNKLSIEKSEISDLTERILSFGDKQLSGAVMSAVQGVSPVVAREIAYRVTYDDAPVASLTGEQVQMLRTELEKIKNGLQSDLRVYMISDKDGKPKDMSHMEVRQYGDTMLITAFETPGELLDQFYYERDRINRINHRAHELIKTLNNLIERTARKLSFQQQELKQCQDKDKLRLYGELILANLYRLGKGVTFYEVENYYESGEMIRIPCNPALSPTENQKKYYKEYRKAQTAEKMLATLIEKGQQELIYLESVLDELSRADTDSEISAVRLELSQAGYIKNTKGKKQKPPRELPPIEFRSSDGFRILVGRNNVQNDKLSLKTAAKSDLWLHTQGIPGSHVIISAEGRDIPDRTIEEAAIIAAGHSRAKDSSLVPVDYTPVKMLKKPNGARAGMVIYHEYRTLIVKPDAALTESLRVK
ncbi:MAG: NFACT RNA binding domain-containing protein [Oscillospiraceae bacterium]|nr:NFACT RNA binding domain-containing protein [Oscillospiraceae bacterium]